MAKGFDITVKGLKEAIDKLGEYAETAKFEVKEELMAAARDISREAQQRLSTINVSANGKNYSGIDTGNLKSSFTTPMFTAEYTVQFTVQAKYAPYIEFGTGNLFVSTGEEIWDEIAKQFKGRGKKRINLPPRPYLRPSVNRIMPIYEKKLKTILEEPRQI